MSNLARKQQLQHDIESQKQIEIQTTPLHKRARITLGEKLLAAFFVAFVCFMAVKIISAQAAIYQVNKNVQDAQATIQNQQKVNEGLQTQVSELSRYDRIAQKAKELGLKLNENNIKVVDKK
jgi:cell division protein FtsL